ncbi:Membrane protease YdiL, CAAX protease family [Geodermatophilus obscurus]|uniref:Membrane protease YdiL, CAAX protease family n=1 Tax=Geodermatophilus obscurus TaxID=1861 RepID=A0A1M7ULR4_9ACTN|nr:CPBP family intramembrane glutamic endopeptidase [Geodermatophilus obscurus]SHN83894.1 Membrane protease YdiL, CAAX protease family [Geodermatophilus obscurus]
MSTDTRRRRPGATTWPRFLCGFVLVYGVLAVGGRLDPTARSGLAVLAAVLATGVLVERVLFGCSWTAARRLLGLGRPGGRALAAATVVAGLVLLVYPLSWMVTGTAVRPRPDWWWLLLGVFALHGLAEEFVWRGYAFRRLREGRSFRTAVWLTMPLVVAAHVPILVTSGPAVGLGAMAVAAVTTVSLSRLYEDGGHTLWAPALVHAAIDSFKLVEIPAGATTSFSLLLVAVSIAVPLLVLLLPRRAPGARAPAHEDGCPPRPGAAPATRGTTDDDR